MRLIDSHCHLNYPEFQEDMSAVLARARANNVEKLLSISTRLDTFPDVLKIAEQNPSVFATIGVHPHDVEDEGVPSFKALKAGTEHSKVVGIGETGLDYFYDNSPREAQRESFQIHIDVAAETGLPLIIHARSAEEDILQMLKDNQVQKRAFPGVIHCFSGSKEFAEETLALGFYISISGIVTFKKAEELREIVMSVPLDRLLVETDAPYLAPVPKRGKSNEPSYVKYTAEKVAELKQVDLEALGALTTENFYKVFSKVPEAAL